MSLSAKAPGAASASSSSAGKKKAGSAAAAAAAAAKSAGTSVSMSAKKPDGAAQQIDHTASSSDLFARSVSMMAIAHVARGAGFDAVQRSAGDALVDILAKCT